jgi:hypothetical protein
MTFVTKSAGFWLGIAAWVVVALAPFVFVGVVVGLFVDDPPPHPASASTVPSAPIASMDLFMFTLLPVPDDLPSGRCACHRG